MDEIEYQLNKIVDEAMVNIRKLPSYKIKIGIIEGSSKDRKKVKKVADVGITNAQLLFIHEKGSPLHHLPKRPILELTIKWANESGLVEKSIDKAMDNYLNSDYDIKEFEKELNKLCVRIQSHLRKMLYDDAFPPELIPRNAPSTIKKKKVDHPLFDTGQLARSIVCVLEKI